MPAANPWFRLYTEACSDRKLRRLKPAQRWLWIAILCAASDSPHRGQLLIAAGTPMSVAELAEVAAMKVSEIQPALDAMVALSMLTVEDGLIVVTNWDSRQFESDCSTDRVRAFRQRRRNAAGNVSGNVSGNGSRNVAGNGPEEEAETETEKTPGPRKRGTRLPDNWQPNAEDVAWARGEKITDFMQRRETDIFVDYWHSVAGAKAVKLDWSLTWRNWLRRVNNEVKLPARANGNAPTFGGW